MEKKEKKPLSAAQGLQAAHILFELNTGAEEILRMAQRSGLPEVFWGGPLAPNLCEEWRAFVHAVVTAGLMQHAPNSVLVAYLRDTYMPLLAHERQKECPLLFFRRLGLTEDGDLFDLMTADALAKAEARIAAVMAMLISAVQDKLEGYDIAAE